ncbi:hypothetical protein TEA_009409 [Camellia sinensis var. sinensis]|uniref:Uncharacterized protein n=1 Tax=Camellia sinensis var. sinensis TaxID=542762 RepID=A0A4S4DF50_CAMSN|nr:hypothetical protein TEA_009409 [Camellia sinensis var. sinensis]
MASSLIRLAAAASAAIHEERCAGDIQDDSLNSSYDVFCNTQQGNLSFALVMLRGMDMQQLITGKICDSNILGNMKKDPASLMLFTVTKKLHKLGYVLKIYPLEDGKARSMWEEIGAQISILSPDRYGHIDWSIFEGIIVNSLGAKDAISRHMQCFYAANTGECLCPVCHGLANSALPTLPGDSQKVSRPPMVQLAADVTGRSKILKAFPMHRNGRIRPNPKSMFCVLSGMYFPGKQDRISGFASHSVIMWDTLKYSLISGSADGLLVCCCCCCRCAAAEFCWVAAAAMLL